MIGSDGNPEIVIVDLETRRSRGLRPVHEERPLLIERVQARGQRLWLIAERTIYTVDVRAGLSVSS